MAPSKKERKKPRDPRLYSAREDPFPGAVMVRDCCRWKFRRGEDIITGVTLAPAPHAAMAGGPTNSNPIPQVQRQTTPLSVETTMITPMDRGKVVVNQYVLQYHSFSGNEPFSPGGERFLRGESNRSPGVNRCLVLTAADEPSPMDIFSVVALPPQCRPTTIVQPSSTTTQTMKTMKTTKTTTAFA